MSKVMAEHSSMKESRAVRVGGGQNEESSHRSKGVEKTPASSHSWGDAARPNELSEPRQCLHDGEDSF